MLFSLRAPHLSTWRSNRERASLTAKMTGVTTDLSSRGQRSHRSDPLVGGSVQRRSVEADVGSEQGHRAAAVLPDHARSVRLRRDRLLKDRGDSRHAWRAHADEHHLKRNVVRVFDFFFGSSAPCLLKVWASRLWPMFLLRHGNLHRERNWEVHAYYRRFSRRECR